MKASVCSLLIFPQWGGENRKENEPKLSKNRQKPFWAKTRLYTRKWAPRRAIFTIHGGHLSGDLNRIRVKIPHRREHRASRIEELWTAVEQGDEPDQVWLETRFILSFNPFLEHFSWDSYVGVHGTRCHSSNTPLSPTGVIIQMTHCHLEWALSFRSCDAIFWARRCQLGKMNQNWWKTLCV